MLRCIRIGTLNKGAQGEISIELLISCKSSREDFELQSYIVIVCRSLNIIALKLHFFLISSVKYNV
jgi:hypothetical protein